MEIPRKLSKRDYLFGLALVGAGLIGFSVVALFFASADIGTHYCDEPIDQSVCASDQSWISGSESGIAIGSAFAAIGLFFNPGRRWTLGFLVVFGSILTFGILMWFFLTR